MHACLERMAKQVVFLTNDARGNCFVKAYLQNMGFMNRIHYQTVYSSGFYFNQYMNELILHGDFRFYHLKHCFIDDPRRINDIKNNFDIEFVSQYSQANYCLCTGKLVPEYINSDELKASMNTLLQALKAHQLIMLCPNPDAIVLDHNNQPQYMAGLIADQYEAMGGQVLYFGKPKPYPYEFILKKFKPKRPLMIGDNLNTDIMGAHALGIDTLLVKSGVSYFEYLQSDQTQDFAEWVANQNYQVDWCIDSLK